MVRRALRALAAAAGALVIASLHAAALLLAPFPIGRLLQTVSIPRMREHTMRTTLTALGIALGVGVLVSVVLVSRSIVVGVTDTVDDLAGRADLQIGGTNAGIDEGLLDKVRDVPGIYKVTPVMQQIVTLRTTRGARERVLVLGVDLLGSEDKYFRNYASKELEEIRRDPLAFLNSSSNVILSRELAQRAGLRLHDKVTIGGGSGEAQDFEIWGFIESEGVGRAFGGAVAVMYYPAMQVAFGRGRQVDRLDIAVTPGSDPERVAAAIEQRLGRGLVIERPAMRGARVEKMLLSVRTALTMASALALLSGAFLVFNTISISIVQRKRELGILRALGTTRRQLFAMLTLEGALLGTVGSLLGIALGVGLSGGMLRITSRAVNEVYMQQAVTEVHVDPQLVAISFVLGVLASVLAALLATRRAAGIKPVEALSSGAQPRAAVGSRRLLRSAYLSGSFFSITAWLLLWLPPTGNVPVGPLLACVALTLAGRALMPVFVSLLHRGLWLVRRGRMGVEAALASDNLPRDLSRTASTASGLMAAASLTVTSATFIVSFVSSLQTWSAQTVPGDLFVTSGAATSGLSLRNTPMSSALREQLLALPGVERVRRTRLTDCDFRGNPVKLIATDVSEFVKRSRITPVERSAAEMERGLLRGEVTVSENFSRLYGVHAGDHIVLGAKDGPAEFTVAGVMVDYTSDHGSVVMDRATFIERFNDTRVDTFELHLSPGVSPEKVRAQINEQLSERFDLFVLTNREFRNEFVKAVDKIFALMRVLELVTLTVAALGMLTAVLANVLDRVREIGVLRALGMLRAQVRKMVVIEATLTGLIGTLAGALVGVAVGYVLLRHITMVQIGWYLPYRVPFGSIIELALVTVPISALAGFYPARHAAQLRVTDALDYE